MRTSCRAAVASSLDASPRLPSHHLPQKQDTSLLSSSMIWEQEIRLDLAAGPSSHLIWEVKKCHIISIFRSQSSLYLATCTISLFFCMNSFIVKIIFSALINSSFPEKKLTLRVPPVLHRNRDVVYPPFG